MTQPTDKKEAPGGQARGGGQKASGLAGFSIGYYTFEPAKVNLTNSQEFDYDELANRLELLSQLYKLQAQQARLMADLEELGTGVL